jgi:hypothetical protein
MSKSNYNMVNDNQSDKTNSNKINRGKQIYFKNKLHYIVYEFDDNVFISENTDFTKVFVVKKKQTSYKYQDKNKK